jgi:hypothetical protein
MTTLEQTMNEEIDMVIKRLKLMKDMDGYRVRADEGAKVARLLQAWSDTWNYKLEKYSNNV